MDKSIQKIVRQVLKEDGLSFAQLARLVGTSPSTVHRIASGETLAPRWTLAKALIDYSQDSERRERHKRDLAKDLPR